VRGDHHNLFLDTMRLRVSHRRADSRNVFATPAERMLSPPRPRDPPPPPPPSSKGEVVVVNSGAPLLGGSTVVTVNNQDSLTLRINVGAADDNNATIVTLNGDENDNYAASVPHICTKVGDVTFGDTSIVQKVRIGLFHTFILKFMPF